MASMTLKKKPMTKDAFLKEWGKHSAQLALADSDPLRLSPFIQTCAVFSGDM